MTHHGFRYFVRDKRLKIIFNGIIITNNKAPLQSSSFSFTIVYDSLLQQTEAMLTGTIFASISEV
jgi:hypothetical protein